MNRFTHETTSNTRQISLALTLLAADSPTALFAAENVSPAAAAVTVVSPARPTTKPKPKFQYKSEGIELPAASAEEPKVKAFGPNTIRAARKYLDVYDAATWSAIAVLSEKSVADRSRPVDFSDFTKGKWKTNPPIQLMGV